MARTFINTPLNFRPDAWHRVRSERGHYIMSPFWIDTVIPRDMMATPGAEMFGELLPNPHTEGAQ